MTTSDLGPTWRWVVGLLLTVALAMIAGWANASDQKASQAAADNVRQDVIITAIKTDVENRNRQLDRIEAKLDRLTEQTK